jgi:hypothetical protein
MIKTAVQYLVIVVIAITFVTGFFLQFPLNRSGSSAVAINQSVINMTTISSNKTLTWVYGLNQSLTSTMQNALNGYQNDGSLTSIALGFGALAAVTLTFGILLLTFPAILLDTVATWVNILFYGMAAYLPASLQPVVASVVGIIGGGAVLLLAGITILFWIFEAVLGRKFE